MWKIFTILVVFLSISFANPNPKLNKIRQPFRIDRKIKENLNLALQIKKQMRENSIREILKIYEENYLPKVIPPDVQYECGLNMCQEVQYRGYVCESYHAETPDGFILTLFRIPSDHQGNPFNPNKLPVLLIHGLLDSSFTWITNFPSQSLGYILADAGYDVWLGNVRGNTYSMNNTKYTPKQDEFWDFSFDEMAQYDLPAMINTVIQVSFSFLIFLYNFQYLFVRDLGRSPSIIH